MDTKIRKHYDGCYRVTLDNPDYFGQIHKVGREWHAEVRRSASGELVRFAGIWSSRREAVEEVTTMGDYR